MESSLNPAAEFRGQDTLDRGQRAEAALTKISGHGA